MKSLKDKFIDALSKQEVKFRAKDIKMHDKNRKALYRKCVKYIKQGRRVIDYNPKEINEKDLEYVINLLHLEDFKVAMCGDSHDEFYVFPKDCKIEEFGGGNYYVYINDERYVMFDVDTFI